MQKIKDIHQERLLFPVVILSFDMSSVYCPKCGKENSTSQKTCVSCGTNLESVIIDFKEKKKPITANDEMLKQAKPKDKFEEASQAVLKIKREEARERIDQLMKSEAESPLKVIFSNVKTKIIFGSLTALSITGLLLMYRYFYLRPNRAVYWIIIVVLLMLFATAWNFLIFRKRIVRYGDTIVVQTYAEKEKEKGIWKLCYWFTTVSTPAQDRYYIATWKNMPKTDKLIVLMFILIDIAIVIIFFLF